MKNRAPLLTFVAAIAAVLLLPVVAHASVTLTGLSYSESFDGDLGTQSLSATSTPVTPYTTTNLQAPIPGTSGWDGTKLGTGTPVMPYTVDNGTTISGAIYSYGATGSTERALGSLASGSNTPAFGVELKNNTGSTIDSVDISYIGEYWRNSTSTMNTLSFKYSVGGSNSPTYLSSGLTASTGLDLVGPASVTTQTNLDGNLAANQANGGSPIAGSLTSLGWTNGTSLYLVWQDFNDVGSDAGLAVDNFSLTAHVAAFTTPYFDGNGSLAGVGCNGTPPFVWDTTTANWNNAAGTGTPVVYTPSQVAIFGGTGGTVTIDTVNGITENGGIQIESNGYTFSGGTLTIGSTNTINVVNGGDSATISAKISGGNGLNKGGPGTLVLSSTASDFSNGVTISGGTLSISADGNLGNTSNSISLSGGTLKSTFAGNLHLDAGRQLTGTGSGGSVDVASGNTLTFDGGANMPVGAALTLSNAGTVGIGGGTKTLGGVVFSTTGTLKFGSGTDPGLIGGNITANSASGTATINGNLNFASISRTISVATGGTLVVTGSVSDSGKLNLTGGGTIDMQGDNSGVTNNAGTMQIGNQGSAGPIVIVHDANSLGSPTGPPGQFFFNSGTIQAAAPITFLNNIGGSLGGTTVPVVFQGSAMEFQAPMDLFKPASGTSSITVNNNTTFSGGWATAQGTAGNFAGLIINGTGAMTLATTSGGTLDAMDVPITVDSATLNVNANMNQPNASVKIINGGTVKNGASSGNSLAAGATVTVGDSNGTGTYDLNGHDQTLSGIHLVNGTIAGAGNTITATGGIGPITITNNGSAYTAAPNVTVSAPGGGGTTATATAFISASATNASVIGVKITDAGTGYTSNPVITIDTSPGGSGKTAKATASFGYFDVQAGSVLANLAGTGIPLKKTGSGTVTLSGANSYTGGTSVTAGILKANNNSALGSSSVAATVAGGSVYAGSGISVPNNVTINAGAVPATTLADWTFETSQPATAGPFVAEAGVNAASSNALGTHAGAAVYSSPSGNGSAHSFSSNTWAANDYYQVSAPITGYSGLSVSWDQTGSDTGPADFSLQYSTDGSTFNPVPAFANYSITNDGWTTGTSQSVSTRTADLSSLSLGSGTLYLRWVNTDTTAINSNLGVAAGGTGRLDNVIISAATGGANTPPASVLGSDITSGSATFAGNVTLNSGVTLTSATGGTVNFNGTIANGTASGTVTKTGGGTVKLNHANTYSGGTTVNAGTLVVANVSALGSGGLSINNTAVTQLQAGLSAPIQLPSLTITGGVMVPGDDLSGLVDNATSSGIADQGGALAGGGGATSVQPVPEPSALILAGLGVAGMGAFYRRRRRADSR